MKGKIKNKKKVIGLTLCFLIVVSIIIVIIKLLTDDYIQFKINYNNKNYKSALNNVLRLNYEQIIGIVNETKKENIPFTIDVLTEIDDSIVNEEVLNIYIDVLKERDFNKEYFFKIVNKIKNIDKNYENIKSKEIIYNFCNSYIKYLDTKKNQKTEMTTEYDLILAYLNKISDYEDSIDKINNINFDLATSYLEKGRAQYINYDLMIKYFDIIDEKYLKIIDRNNTINIANIFFEIAEKYEQSAMYAYSEQYYEKAINILKINEEENKEIIEKYEFKYLEEQEKSKKYEWCEAYGCARKKVAGNLHYCQTHKNNNRELTPVATEEKNNNSKYSMYHKCEEPGCSNYASKCKYCSKHKKEENKDER